MKGINEAIIRSMVGRLGEDEPESTMLRPLEIQARNCRDMLEEVMRPCPFRSGDLVVQRKNAMRYRWPSSDEVAIVSHVAQPGEKLRDNHSQDNTFTRQDMLILCLASDDTWVEYAVESWRFDRYEGEVDAS